MLSYGATFSTDLAQLVCRNLYLYIVFQEQNYFQINYKKYCIDEVYSITSQLSLTVPR